MSDTPEVIELLAGVQGQFIHSEAIAASGSAIVPGMLVEIFTAGQVRENSGAAGTQFEKLVALPDLTTGGNIDKAYAVGATVRYGAAHSGQEAYMLLQAGAEAMTGAPLESGGDGTLREPTTGAPVAWALEDVDNSGGGTAVRVKVRIA